MSESIIKEKSFNFSIRIVNLFGLYNYEIPISESEHICLLTGPNGYGKTTILSIIDNLFKGYLFYFYKLPFDEIYVELSENNIISIIKRNISAQNLDSGDSPLTHDTEVKFEWRSEEVVTAFVINNKILVVHNFIVIVFNSFVYKRSVNNFFIEIIFILMV